MAETLSTTKPLRTDEAGHTWAQIVDLDVDTDYLDRVATDAEVKIGVEEARGKYNCALHPENMRAVVVNKALTVIDGSLRIGVGCFFCESGTKAEREAWARKEIRVFVIDCPEPQDAIMQSLAYNSKGPRPYNLKADGVRIVWRHIHAGRIKLLKSDGSASMELARRNLDRFVGNMLGALPKETANNLLYHAWAVENGVPLTIQQSIGAQLGRLYMPPVAGATKRLTPARVKQIVKTASEKGATQKSVAALVSEAFGLPHKTGSASNSGSDAVEQASPAHLLRDFAETQLHARPGTQAAMISAVLADMQLAATVKLEFSALAEYMAPILAAIDEASERPPAEHLLAPPIAA